MDEERAQIVTFLLDHSGSSAKNLYGALGIPVERVETILDGLRAEGVVVMVTERTKKGTTHRWGLAETPSGGAQHMTQTTKQRVLEYVRHNPGSTSGQIASALTLGGGSVRRDLIELQYQSPGVVRKEREGNRVVWFAANAPNIPNVEEPTQDPFYGEDGEANVESFDDNGNPINDTNQE